MNTSKKRPYLKLAPHPLLFVKHWQQFDGEQGYTEIDDPHVVLAMQKAPPPLVQTTPSDAANAPPQHKHPYHNEILEYAKDKYGEGLRFAIIKGMLNMYQGEKPPSAAAAPSPAPSADKQNQCQAPTPFDLLDIPESMRAMGWPKAAKLARRWLHGREHIASADPTARFDEDMIDTDTLSLSWVLGFNVAKWQYQKLLETAIYNDAAKKELKKSDGTLPNFMERNRFFSGKLFTWNYCKGDIEELHRQFHFQHIPVNTYDEMKNMNMSELTAALGNFNLYAAIADAYISTKRFNRYDSATEVHLCTRSTVTISHIYVYAKDSYSFTDDPMKHASQYLGHWSRHGMVISVLAFAAQFLTDRPKSTKDWEWGNTPIESQVFVDDFGKPIDIAQGMQERNVYYPVRNRDYRQWRACHKRGGDFVVYTDLRRIKLTTPIVLQLEDVCQRTK